MWEKSTAAREMPPPTSFQASENLETYNIGRARVVCTETKALIFQMFALCRIFLDSS